MNSAVTTTAMPDSEREQALRESGKPDPVDRSESEDGRVEVVES